MSTNNDRIFFLNFDVVRFVAAYLIIILHGFTSFKSTFGPIYPLSLYPEDSWINKIANIAIENCHIGVDIFFLISGFLITYLLLAEKDRTGTVNISKFYIRRSLRIWPLYYLTVFLVFLIAKFHSLAHPDYLYYMFFLTNYEFLSNGLSNYLVIHLWSICVEEHYYIFIPLFLYLMPVRYIPHIMFSIIGVSIAYRLSVYNVHEYWNLVYLNTLSRIDVLALGSLFGYYFFKGSLKFTSPLYIRLFFYGILVFLFFTEPMAEMHSRFLIGFKKYIYVLLAGYWIGNYMFHPQAILTFKKANFIHYLGRVSYGLYMFNPLVFFYVIRLFQGLETRSFTFYMLLTSASVIGVSLISYHLFEKQFLLLKERFTVVKSGKALTSEEIDEKITEDRDKLKTSETIK